MILNKTVGQLLMIFSFAISLVSGGIIFSGLECHTVDPSFCTIINCIVKPLGRGLKEINARVRLLKVPVDNVTVRAKILRRGDSRHALYSFDIDGCQFWKTKRRNPIAFAMYKILRLDTYTNINHSCPYDHDIIFDHYIIDNTFNLILPIGNGEYILKSQWIAYNVLRARVDVKFSINHE